MLKNSTVFFSIKTFPNLSIKRTVFLYLRSRSFFPKNSFGAFLRAKQCVFASNFAKSDDLACKVTNSDDIMQTLR